VYGKELMSAGPAKKIKAHCRNNQGSSHEDQNTSMQNTNIRHRKTTINCKNVNPELYICQQPHSTLKFRSKPQLARAVNAGAAIIRLGGFAFVARAIKISWKKYDSKGKNPNIEETQRTNKNAQTLIIG
jgi:hypothetical protein